MQLTKGLTSNPQEEVLISGGGDGTIKIWLLDETGGAIEEMHSLGDDREQGESVLSIAIDGTFLYAGRADGEVNMWDLETRQLVRNLKTRTDDVLALSVGGGFIFCAGLSGVVEVSYRTSISTDCACTKSQTEIQCSVRECQQLRCTPRSRTCFNFDHKPRTTLLCNRRK
jgi:WD40 repeat protein